MLEKFKYITSKKSFHACMMIIIITVILFILLITVLRYAVEGETNMPFNLTKITIISSAEGVSKDDTQDVKWNLDISQNNDIYLYIEKNAKFTKQEAIKNILIDNIQVTKQEEIGDTSFYRPNILEEGASFSNKEENVIQFIEYQGALETDLKNLKISNQGGIIAFRVGSNKVAEYQSNDDEINHAELLKKAGIAEDKLKAGLSFDITIKIESGKEYKANISLELPVQGLVESGISHIEITDLKNIIFKRIKN